MRQVAWRYWMKHPRPQPSRRIMVRWPLIIVLVIALNACAPQAGGTLTTVPSSTAPGAVVSPSATRTPSPTATPQPTAASVSYGPDPADFPSGLNPLTGQPVSDPDLLKPPTLLVSISHFPATARPQAGLSFAPFVYEYYITEGATRFLAVFYGESPQPE